MKIDNRSVIKQNEYKTKLLNESIDIYGRKICFVTKLPFRTLIASHIKPYKLCVIENDTDAMFDINNGLLLSKELDDYFDKFYITFDESGKIIFCDNIPDEIIKYYSEYKLDSIIFNENRKKYMNVHRALFYYKNYFYDFNNEIKENINSIFLTKDIIVKYLVNKDIFLIKNVDGLWEYVKKNKVKNCLIKYNYMKENIISNDKICNFIKNNPIYKVEDFFCNKNIIHFSNCSFNFLEKEYENKEYIIQNKINVDFKYIIDECFNTKINELFSLYFSSKENGIVFLKLLSNFFFFEKMDKKIIILSGNNNVTYKIIKLINKVFGEYCPLIDNPNFIKQSIQKPINKNVNIYLLGNQKSLNDNLLYELFEKNISGFNVDERKYNVILCVEEARKLYNKNDYYIFEINSKIDELKLPKVDNEFICKFISYMVYLIEQPIDIKINENNSRSSIFDLDNIFEKWVLDSCDICVAKTSFKILYDSFIEYCRENQPNYINDITITWFGRRLSKKFTKYLKNGKVYYKGVSLKY